MIQRPCLWQVCFSNAFHIPTRDEMLESLVWVLHLVDLDDDDADCLIEKSTAAGLDQNCHCLSWVLLRSTGCQTSHYQKVVNPQYNRALFPILNKVLAENTLCQFHEMICNKYVRSYSKK
jgi:hypothetical protein